MLFLMSSPWLSGSSNQPVYSLTSTNTYAFKRETRTPGVVPNIPFYVTQQFRTNFPEHSNEYKRVERSVEADYRDLLVSKCHKEKEYKMHRIYQARWKTRDKAEEMKKAESIELASCDLYNELFVGGRRR